MKTTIDVPEHLLHRAKITAAQRKTTLKDLVLKGLEYVTTHDVSDLEAQRQARAKRLIAALQAENVEPMKPLKRNEIYER